MKKKTKVDEFKKVPIYFSPEFGKFSCDYGGMEYESNDLLNLKRDLEKSTIVPMKKEFYTTDYSGIKKVKALRKWEDRYSGKTRIQVERLEGVGGEDTVEPDEIFPINAHNTELYNRGKKLNDEGWRIIHQGEALAKQLTR